MENGKIIIKGIYPSTVLLADLLQELGFKVYLIGRRHYIAPQLFDEISVKDFSLAEYVTDEIKVRAFVEDNRRVREEKLVKKEFVVDLDRFVEDKIIEFWEKGGTILEEMPKGIEGIVIEAEPKGILQMPVKFYLGAIKNPETIVEHEKGASFPFKRYLVAFGPIYSEAVVLSASIARSTIIKYDPRMYPLQNTLKFGYASGVFARVWKAEEEWFYHARLLAGLVAEHGKEGLGKFVATIWR